MEFCFHRVDALPKLAWLAVVEQDRERVDVLHGPWVEGRDSFFVEGAWDGAFPEGRFDASYLLMGSGGRMAGDKVLFCSPCHAIEQLYLVVRGRRLYVSNSLTFLLKVSGCQLDFGYIPYQADMISIMDGLEARVPSIPTKQGPRIRLHPYCNLEVGSDLQVRELKKPVPPEFSGFGSYRKFLSGAIGSLMANADCAERTARYAPMVTISSGYDSPASSVLAVENGCREAVTIRDAKPEYADRNDSGREIGELLGLNVREYDRDAYISDDGLPEAEFVACGNFGQDLVWSAFEEAFSQRLVFTGSTGDEIWERTYLNVSRQIIRNNPMCCSIAEFRLRTGFVHVPVPALGCASHPSIHAISNSSEMKEWSTGNARYDRPISRRILQERGVDGRLFGRAKRNVSVMLNSNKALQSQMNPESYRSFVAFYAQQKHRRNPLIQAMYQVLHGLFVICNALGPRADHLTARVGIPRLGVPHPVPRRFRQSPGRPSFLFHWGVATIEDRYDVTQDELTRSQNTCQRASR